MEGAINLTVPLQVKMKVGPAWGSLSDYSVPLPVPLPLPQDDMKGDVRGSVHTCSI